MHTCMCAHTHTQTHTQRGVIKHGIIYDTHSLGPSNVTESFPTDAVTCVCKDKYKTVLQPCLLQLEVRNSIKVYQVTMTLVGVHRY